MSSGAKSVNCAKHSVFVAGGRSNMMDLLLFFKSCKLTPQVCWQSARPQPRSRYCQPISRLNGQSAFYSQGRQKRYRPRVQHRRPMTLRVKPRKAQAEQFRSAFVPIANMERTSRHVADGPSPDARWSTHELQDRPVDGRRRSDHIRTIGPNK